VCEFYGSFLQKNNLEKNPKKPKNTKNPRTLGQSCVVGFLGFFGFLGIRSENKSLFLPDFLFPIERPHT